MTKDFTYYIPQWNLEKCYCRAHYSSVISRGPEIVETFLKPKTLSVNVFACLGLMSAPNFLVVLNLSQNIMMMMRSWAVNLITVPGSRCPVLSPLSLHTKEINTVSGKIENYSPVLVTNPSSRVKFTREPSWSRPHYDFSHRDINIQPYWETSSKMQLKVSTNVKYSCEK